MWAIPGGEQALLHPTLAPSRLGDAARSPVCSLQHMLVYHLPTGPLLPKKDNSLERTHVGLRLRDRPQCRILSSS